MDTLTNRGQTSLMIVQKRLVHLLRTSLDVWTPMVMDGRTKPMLTQTILPSILPQINLLRVIASHSLVLELDSLYSYYSC